MDIKKAYNNRKIQKYQKLMENKNSSQSPEKESTADLDNLAESDSGIEIIQIEGNPEVKTEPVEEGEGFGEENVKDEDYTPTGSAEVRVRYL